jgi:Concanavalin A-like lectin/glucanases superfamily
VNLDATALPEGALDTWANTGTASGSFTSSGTAVPAVVTQSGVKGVSFTGAANHYLGPVAPDVVTAGGTRTIEAWVFNPAGSDFETIIAWGRREGPDNSNSSFSHGVHGTWGAFGGWGAADLDWQGKIAFGRWNYIVYTYDGGTSSAYADGVLANSEPITLDTWAFDSVDGNPLPFRGGAQNLANGTVAVNEPATMVIARVRVHDVPLTTEEVAAKYAAEKGFFGYNDDDGDGLPNAYELQYSDILNPNDPTDAAMRSTGPAEPPIPSWRTPTWTA